MPKTYHVWTIGCQMNEADTRHLSSQLEALGYVNGTPAEEADLVVLNTCVVRQQAEDKAVNQLHRLRLAKRERPSMTIALMGCMVGMREAPGLRQRFPFVDAFLPPSDARPLFDLLAERSGEDPARGHDVHDTAFRNAVQNEEYTLPAGQRGRSVIAHIPVVLGCSHACSFCVIPYRRGAERSQPAAAVLEEIRALVDQGVREVMLLGQIIDRYGTDLDDGADLAGLLRRTAAIPGLHRVRFLTSHPNWMTDRLIDTVADTEKICPHIEIPVQAGNDEVLRNMRRGYTVDDYRRVVDRIRRRMPDAAVHTDIIVGFCGETEAQFMDTCRLTEELQWEKMHLAKYSVRPKTIATRTMQDDVPPEEKERRRKYLDDLQTAILEKKNRALLDQTVQVLAENRHKGKWRGRTETNKLVFFESDQELTGQLVDVRITATRPYTLQAVPLDPHAG